MKHFIYNKFLFIGSNVQSINSHVLNKDTQGITLNHHRPCYHSGWYTSKRWQSTIDPDKEARDKAKLLYGSIAAFTLVVTYGLWASDRFHKSFDDVPKK